MKNGVKKIQTAGYNGARTVIIFVSDSEEKSHKRKDWMISIAWAICPLLGENKTENAPFLQYRLGD